jgi:hypothetical protein
MGEIFQLFPKDVSYLDNIIPISQFIFDFESQEKDGTHAQVMNTATSKILFVEFGQMLSFAGVNESNENILPFTKN